MIPGVTRGALKTVLMVAAGVFLITEILKEISFSNSLHRKTFTHQIWSNLINSDKI
jgi:hypothetical protein